MGGYARAPVPPCEGCGGPLTVRAGQSFVGGATVTFDADNGEVLDVAPMAAWCGDCIEEWNARMGFTEPHR